MSVCFFLTGGRLSAAPRKRRPALDRLARLPYAGGHPCSRALPARSPNLPARPMVPPNEPPCAAPSPPAVPAREGITTGPPEDVRIPLPAEPWAPPPERRPPAREAESGRLGGALVFLVAALAFLLASFPARNGDLWLHLAAGRLLAHGESPFAAGAGLPVNVPAGPGWAYDLLTYALYSALGGAGLVVLKALLVVGLALILTRLGRAGRGWTLPAFCAALALLAMSTRL